MSSPLTPPDSSGQWQQAPQYPAPTPYAAYPYAPARPTDGFAVTSFILGLLGLAILPVIFGHVALSRIKRTGAGGKAFAIIGLILGYIEIAIYLAAIAFVVFVVWVSTATAGVAVIGT